MSGEMNERVERIFWEQYEDNVAALVRCGQWSPRRWRLKRENDHLLRLIFRLQSSRLTAG